MQEYAEILIIDDEPDHIAFAGSILRSEGYRVFAVTDGKSAFQFLKTRHPDIIMLDIRMDNMDGLEVCRILKNTPETADIPVIFLTAENNPETIRQGFSLGGCDYIVKPFIREEYLARVKTHLDIFRKNRALAAANQELKQFCSAVSHDLKSPLNVINMLISSLRDELEDNKIENSTLIMNMIQEKSQKLILMIERLLEFSKMCNIIPETEVLDMNQLVSDIYNEFIELEPDRIIEFKLDRLPEIKGDPVLVEMLLKNIISNAFKFTRKRAKAEIKVSGEEIHGYKIIKIKDNGAGFDMQYSDKLFQIFQRLHTDEEFEGTGVGLALASRIMKRHGGKLEAKGEIDKGAEIILYFLQ